MIELIIIIVCLTLVASKIIRAIWEAKLLEKDPAGWKELKAAQEIKKAKWRRGIGDVALSLARYLLDEK